jgi:hypothetical protein
MNSATLQMRVDAHQQAADLGLLDAVRTIAKSGAKQHGATWSKDWNGLRFYYGERSSDPAAPYCEVHRLAYSLASGAVGKTFAKIKPEHHDTVGNVRLPDPHPETVSGCELLYEHSDLDGGITRALRSGTWTDAVVAEAQRISSTPPVVPAAVVAEDAGNFAPFRV